MFRGAAQSARRPAALLGLAMLVIVAGDVYLGYRQSHGGAGAPDRWQFACWLTGHFTLTMAALAQCQRASRHRLHNHDAAASSASNLPYVAIALSYLLLLLSVQGQHIRVLGLVAGAVIITAVVVARQIIALRQNHELAITDALTGLVNRRQLHDRLRLALTRSARNGQGVAALLLDMNGFKLVNDTMGHEAGDQLLIAFGQLLRRNVLGLDVVGRLGGDEFAVVLHNIDTPESAAAIARRIIAEMQQPVMIGDTPVQPRAAIGVAISAPGQLTADELLHHADVAMYRAKRANTTGYDLYREQATGEHRHGNPG
jgi:diguanylate cyclase (GGDEF)-like protein